MARIPYRTPDDAPADIAAVLTALPLHVVQLLAHADTAFRSWMPFGGALLNALALDPALRELAILKVGHTSARYEWDQHVPIALEIGLTQAEIDAVASGDLGVLSAQRRAVVEYVEAFVAGEVDDARHAAVSAFLPVREVVELGVVAGHYLMLARLMSALRIDPDPPVGWAGLRALRS